ncbi:MAG: reverse transcriptase domain-containing protein [Oceanicaulis sp.]
MLEALASFSLWKSERQERAAIRHYVMSASVKLAHVSRLWNKELGEGALNALQLVAMSKRIRMNEPTLEPSFIARKEKPRGGYRRVCDFSREARVKQRVAQDVLFASRRWRDHQYALNGGPIAARKDLRRAMARPDLKYAIVADIQDFYGSVNQGAAMEMSLLPEQVAKTVLLPRSYRFVGEEAHRSDSLSTSSLGQLGLLASGDWTGLLQGSAISPYLAEVVISDLRDLVERVAGNVPFFCSYSDDHLMLSESEDRAVSLLRALEDVLASHPAGPFRLRGRPRIVSLEEGFEFLGCHFSRRGAHVSVERLEDQEDWFFCRLLSEADEAFDGEVTHGTKVPNMLAGAEGAFPDAPRFLARLAEMRRILNVPR